MKTPDKRGFTMVEILVVLAVLAVLCAVFLPGMMSTQGRKARATTINCTNNLKQVALGFRQWGMDHFDAYPTQVPVSSNGVMEIVEAGYIAPAFSVISNEIHTPKVLHCPTDETRKAATSFSKEFYEANISYFLALDANELNPQMILMGDDNIEVGGKLAGRGRLDVTNKTLVSWSDRRHEKQGKVALADGSVQGFSTSKLREAIANCGKNNLRLAFP